MSGSSEQIPPHKVLLVLLLVGLLSLGLMAIFPKSGLKLGSMNLTFKTLASFTDSTSTGGSIEGGIDQFLTQYDSIPPALNSSADSLKVKRQVNIASIQFKDNDPSPLFTFFERLKNIADAEKVMHILHYGDSQIESDRITGFVRSEIQKRFGGNGPGLIPPVPITESANISQSQSSSWKRYTAYGFQDLKSSHSKFGVMASYGRYTASRSIDQINPTDSTMAWLEFKPSYMAQSSSKIYSKATLFAGNNLFDVRIEVYADDSLFSQKILSAGTGLKTLVWHFGSTPQKLRFVFHGADSPDVHAICLEGESGVVMDNIALRGSSGNIFTKINDSELRTAYEYLSPGLVVLQFGGNTVPFIKSEQSALDYGNFFQSQIQYLKKLCPGASFIVIGPSDMSTRIDGVYQTWPYLENVRDAMKIAAFEEGCGFWDMYSVMGGRNSMISWVENSPPYAAPDYTHFTPKGARKVAEIFFHSLMSEYDAWQGQF
jgi:lysophospholipase L1-like esterase